MWRTKQNMCCKLSKYSPSDNVLEVTKFLQTQQEDHHSSFGTGIVTDLSSRCMGGKGSPSSVWQHGKSCKKDQICFHSSTGVWMWCIRYYNLISQFEHLYMWFLLQWSLQLGCAIARVFLQSLVLMAQHQTMLYPHLYWCGNNNIYLILFPMCCICVYYI